MLAESVRVPGADGEPAELRVTLLGEDAKAGGVIHWVSATRGVSAEFRLFDRLFTVAEPDSEASLLEVALEMTASQVERTVRQWRRADRLDDGGIADVIARATALAQRSAPVLVLRFEADNEAELQRIKDNNEPFVDAIAMLDELRADNQALVKSMREVHDVCDEDQDIATASLLENWIDEAEQRIWFLFESTRTA